MKILKLFLIIFFIFPIYSLKIVVDIKIKEGLSEKQIYSYFQSKYGEWILYAPLFNKNTYFLWLLPLLIFFIGGAIVFKNFKKTN